MKISDILRITGGRLLSGRPEHKVELSKVSTDSRTVRRGEFFIALKGPRFDGSDFADDALKKGATGVMVTHVRPGMRKMRKDIVQVKDTTASLEDLASYNRASFPIPLIAVTGSNGKTTAKDMTAAILSTKHNVLKNEGTKNNNIGVSQTLLKLKAGHEISVLELGTNHYGEIRSLTRIARPDIALITNIGPSHLEFLRTLNGVFRAKSEILESFRCRGMVILNGDDRFLAKIRDPRLNIARFGLGKANDFRASDIRMANGTIRFRLNGGCRFELRLLGIHNVYNALAAIAVASQFDISYDEMRRALLDYKPADMRLNIKSVLNGVTLINDSYNSNPLSMQVALEALKRYPAKSKWVVAGDMLELGRRGRHFHRMLGRMVKECGLDGLLTFGALSRAAASQARKCGMDNTWHCSTHQEIADILMERMRSGDAVLIKGSRGMRMEEVIDKLKRR